MGDKLIMNANERKRKVVMESIISGHYNLAEGAKRLEISYRQAKRIKARYLHAGDAGLLHKARGISSPRALPNAFKEKVLILYQTKYMGFGPTFAAEKLKEEDDCDVHRETLRLCLKAAGLRARQRKHNAHRSRRVRRDSFGELLQIDGSHHDWFGTGEHYDCLLNIVDDATGKTLSQMDTGETCRILLMTFKWWVERYGVPLAVYVDLNTDFHKSLTAKFDPKFQLSCPLNP